MNNIVSAMIFGGGGSGGGYTKAEVDTLLEDKLDINQGEDHAGDFLVVGDDGNITTKTLEVWQGGDY